MFARFVLVTVVASLLGCAQPGQTMTTENQQIVSAILAQLPDEQSSYKKLAKEYPEKDGLFGRMVDHRLCVARHIAGAPRELDRDDVISNAAPSPAEVGKRWEESKVRTSMPTSILPKHLRWDGPLSYCPSGMIRLGTPKVAGNTARVYIENRCSGWCGWGAEVLLKRSHKRWRVTEKVNWWQA